MLINSCQTNIKEYYFTTKGGLITGIRVDRRLASEIHKRPSVAATNDFRTATYVPKLAYDQKIGTD